MDSESKPNCEQGALLSAPIIFKTDNSEERFKLVKTCQINDIVTTSSKSIVVSIKTTSFQISSHLGEQFTLVGAKPSGTS